VKRSSWRAIALGTLLLLAVSAGLAAAWLRKLLLTPHQGFPGAELILTIPAGASTSSVLAALEKAGVILDARAALLYLRVYERGRTLKAGEYRFAGARSTAEALAPLLAGEVLLHHVTVPEGLTASEIFDVFTARGFGSREGFQRLFGKPAEFRAIPEGAPSLEGFLFPDTYTFRRGVTEKELVSLMARQLVRRLPPGFAGRAREQGFSLLQAVTLASIVEKETSVGSERPLVAAVYRNRLRLGMPLQADPTTVYSLRRLGRWSGALTRDDLALDEPYNTYVHAGLPPGPICSPGLASLEAALAPADVPYLYFVARGDGSHRFASGYSEHARNVGLYRAAARTPRKKPSRRVP
jgi:UPF0755 protein